MHILEDFPSSVVQQCNLAADGLSLNNLRFNLFFTERQILMLREKLLNILAIVFLEVFYVSFFKWEKCVVFITPYNEKKTPKNRLNETLGPQNKNQETRLYQSLLNPSFSLLYSLAGYSQLELDVRAKWYNTHYVIIATQRC